MPDLNPNLDAMRRHFDVFDNAANGGTRDGKVSREDIQAVADGNRYSSEQRAAARYLLGNREDFALLDTGHHGGKLYAADGTISRGDVDAVLKRAPVFAETATFVADAPTIPEGTERGFSDPVAAAAQTEEVRFGSSNGDASATSQFMRFVSEHQNDPRWLQDYFQTLGADRTAEYLSNVTDPGRYLQQPAKNAEEALSTVRSALQNMHQAGALNDADIARLVERWALDSSDFSPGVAQLFSGMKGPEALDMQNAFARASAELALNGQNLPGSKFTFSDARERLSDGDRESLAAASAHVLGNTSWENTTMQMIELQGDGGDAAVERFISLAMANPTQVPAITEYTNEAQQARTRGEQQPGASVEYDGVARIVEALSYDSTYRGGPDRYLPPAPYSFAELRDVRDQVFYAASNGLDANRDQWQDNLKLKDGLSGILRADLDHMVEDSRTANGARIEAPLPKALENFAQNVLFTSPSGLQRDVTSEFLSSHLSGLIRDVNTLSDADFAARHPGFEKVQMTHLVGSMLGHIDNGMEQAVQVASDKEASQKQAMEFGLNLTYALAQDGIKLAPGGNVIAAILPDQITNSATYGHISGELTSLLQQGATDQALSLLLDKFPDLQADTTLASLTDKLSGIVSAPHLAELLSSYSYADNNPADGG